MLTQITDTYNNGDICSDSDKSNNDVAAAAAAADYDDDVDDGDDGDDDTTTTMMVIIFIMTSYDNSVNKKENNYNKHQWWNKLEQRRWDLLRPKIEWIDISICLPPLEQLQMKHGLRHGEDAAEYWPTWGAWGQPGGTTLPREPGHEQGHKYSDEDCTQLHGCLGSVFWRLI